MKHTLTSLVLALTILFPSLANPSFSQTSLKPLDHYCPKERCTPPITELKVGKFSFKKLKKPDPSDKWVDALIRFGTATNEEERVITFSKTYRIINGPVPLKLDCVDGNTIGFADLDLWALQFNGMDAFDGRGRQKGEKTHYFRPADATFSHFSEKPTTIGVLVNSYGATGHGGSTLYLYDTETGKAASISADCKGSF